MKRSGGQKYLIVFRCIISDFDGRILLVRRSGKRNYNPGKWELPGGKLEPGVDVGDSIETIVDRETGLVVDPTSRRYFYQSRSVSEPGKYQGCTYIEIVGEARYLGGDVSVGGDIVRYEWVQLSSVLSYNLSLESKKSLARYVSEVTEAQKAEGPGRIPVVLAAKALIRDTRGRYLFLQRSRENSSPLKWELPGGKLNSFEVLGELLRREVFEETSLIIKIEKPAIYINSHVVSEGKYKGHTFIEIVSEASLSAGRVEISSEHEAFRWVLAKDIFNLDLVDTSKMPLTEIFLKDATVKN